VTRTSAPPVWLMGLSNTLFGMYGGILVITVPQLLNARKVPEATIAAMTTAMISPGFWTFLVSPILDVRFSRRWYSVVTAVAAAALLTLALLNLDHLAWVTGLLVAGFFFANLFQSALGGWLSSIVAPADQKRLSVWVTIGNISGNGVMAVVAGEFMLRLAPTLAALALGATLLLPIAVFPWMQAPGPDRRLARESFSRFFHEIIHTLKGREVVIAIILFIAPASTFSLVNIIVGLGSDFQASPEFVGRVGGAGVTVAGAVGCFAFALVNRLLPLRYLYLAIGVTGSCFTLGLILLPLSPTTFAVALIGENVFQSCAITATVAIAFETIGRNNPLAATTFCLMISAANIANTYMLMVDNWGYTLHGVAGSYGVDACVSLMTVTLLTGMLLYVSRQKRPAPATLS
jgi:MFS transporter, PAT family, beta-lactamase induction signal transducer AmpG